MNSLFKIVTDSVASSAANNDYKISRQSVLVQDLELMMSIGIHDFEKEKPQRVMVNIDLEIDKDSKPQSDNIDQVISYVDIIEQVQKLAQSKHYELVETFANDVASACLGMGDQTQKVSVKIQKPDVMENVNVGVTLTATK